MGFLTAFGGFAGGLSASIEKNRDRKLEQDKINQDKIDKENELVREKQKSLYELGNTTSQAFADINERIAKVKSGDIELTESEAIKEVNLLNKQKLDIYNKSMKYGIDNLGAKDPRQIYDLSKDDIGQVAVYPSDGKRYIINKELGNAVDQSKGQLRIVNGEIQQRVMKQNSQGAWIPEKDSTGQFIYESTGQALSRVEDMFKVKVTEANSTKGTSTGISTLMSEDEKEYYKSNGIDPDSITLSTLQSRRKEIAKDNLKKEENNRKSEIGINFIDNRLDPKSDNFITYGKTVTGKDISQAQAAQPTGKKMGETKKTELIGKLSIYKDGVEIVNYIEDNNINFDLAETAKAEIAKATGVASWFDVFSLLSKDEKSMTPEEVAKAKIASAMMTKRITADTKLQNLVANYVKIISGAAVTDEERKTFYNIITAGKYSDEKALLTAMTSFVDSIGTNYRNTYDSMKYEFPADYVISVKTWNDAPKLRETNKKKSWKTYQK